MNGLLLLEPLSGVVASLRDPILGISSLFLIPLDYLVVSLYGMLAAALTEVLNVFPVLAKRLGIDGKIIILIMAIVLGKIFGSIFQWVYLCSSLKI